jgi:hypothetical protein
MASTKYYEDLVSKDYYAKRRKGLKKKFKAKRAAADKGTSTDPLIEKAEREDEKRRAKAKQERKRHEKLLKEYGKDAPKGKGFLTSRESPPPESKPSLTYRKKGGSVGRGRGMGVALRGGGMVTKG